jgi:hypothetical protein
MQEQKVLCTAPVADSKLDHRIQAPVQAGEVWGVDDVLDVVVVVVVGDVVGDVVVGSKLVPRL